MSSRRKDIQRERMWRYFIDATVKVIEEEGINNVTIRKVADHAGYTSSTVYNYFKELSHLVFFAAMRFTKDYTDELPQYMEKGNNTVEKWLYSWECFCRETFLKPEIYSAIFVNNLGVIPEDLLDHYYKTYKQDLVDLPRPIQSIVLQHQLAKRSSLYLQSAVDEGLLDQEDIEFLTDTTLLVWKGMLVTYLNQRQNYSVEEVTQKSLEYIHDIVMKSVKAEKREKIEVDFIKKE
ncbi:TetR family transcriptional regulator [Halalkalibacillus sediminis]|uniref:TetR family transcriptional regulator n=1 Tax=Halalkalibacillus sediminis TaxID=2018042 RepID=A0A2I0QV05_9BACI|nr:TetR/AcrR family transcriptional regulator [Halalkalibacillus sediminis]PKR78156.1 TetR family transcriptional regulator [Halalkalibacillus sediminis]